MRKPLAAAASVALLASIFPTACGDTRDAARLGALQAGIASAQASLAALSAAGPSPAPPVPRLSPPAPVSPARPMAEAGPRFHAGARPLAASDLVGAGPDALRRWFGDPDLRRAEGDAEVLLFLGAGCALDLVLYEEGGAKRVAHAAARAEGPAAVTEADCLRGIGGVDGGGRGGVGGAAAAGHTPRR